MYTYHSLEYLKTQSIGRITMFDSHAYPNDVLELEDGLGLADLPGFGDEHAGLEEEEVALLGDAVALCLREPVLQNDSTRSLSLSLSLTGSVRELDAVAHPRFSQGGAEILIYSGH